MFICTGCKFAALESRSYANKLCPYVPRFNLKFNTRISVRRRNYLSWNVRSDSNSLLSRYKCVCWWKGGGGLPRYYYCGCAAETIKLHSYKSKPRKSILLISFDIKTLPYSYHLFQSMTSLNPTKPSHPHALAAN